MSDTYSAVIPYESMDPLAIGATDDESKKHRDTLDARDPDRQPDRRGLPGRACPGRRRHGCRTRGARPALRRADLRRADRREAECRRDHRQPVPPDPVVEAPARRLRRDRGGRRHATFGSSARTGRSSRCPRPTWSRSSAGRTSPAWSRTGGRSTRTTRRTPTRTRSSASRPAARPCGCTPRSRRAR